MVSNIGTASNHLPKYLAKIMSPLSQSEYTVKNTKKFVQDFSWNVPADNYKLVSFDVTLLFTKVPLDYTRRYIGSYLNRERNWDQHNKERIKRPTYSLYEKCTFFFFNGQLYLQKNGIAMGSPLGPVITGIFMIEL